MRSIRPDAEALRNKAVECEHAAEFVMDNDTRVTCRRRAKFYRELLSEAELTNRRSQVDESTRKVICRDRADL